MKMLFLLPSAFILLFLIASTDESPSQARGSLALYVSPSGNDSWSGRLPSPNRSKSDGPFATLERARDEIRRLKRENRLPKNGVIIYLRKGIYILSHPFTLSSEDSGTRKSPIVYQAYRGESVRIIGGKEVKNWQVVEGEDVLSHLPENVRGKVYQANLKELGITDFGSPAGGGLELFFNDKPMTLARYPNEGFIYVGDVLAQGKFKYEDERVDKWVNEKDAWLEGYWYFDWADQRQKVKKIDPENKTIEVEPPYHHYGYRKGQWFYGYNLLCELDSPGEWYLDRETGILYFYPPSPLKKGRAFVSQISNLILMKEVSNVCFRGLTFEVARGDAIRISGGENVEISDCLIRNVFGWAVIVEGGKEHKVRNCEIYETGCGGINLNGGDRKTLTPARHLAENNHIHHYARWHRMYNPAISLNGVGNIARHNLIHDAPHQAFSFSGNEHLIEFNEIYRVCLESNDAGAIYSGRDWTWRGNIIRFNSFRDINGFGGRGCVGVYLDDALCGTLVYGNIFQRVTNAAFIGGGRDNVFENNIFIDCNPAVHIDARAMGWMREAVNTILKERLLQVPYKEPPWRERYPQLVNILEDEPEKPKGNIVRKNICVGGRWLDLEEVARPYVIFEDNLRDVDPRFIDMKKGDFRLAKDSPAFKIGFKPIPFEKIGLKRK
ncbi:MAG: right-handed parallel beta-helix repeat-containing protein [bacterium]